MSERISLSGIGLVSPFGWGFQRYTEGIVSGKSALGPITRINTQPFRNSQGGQVPDSPENAHHTLAEQFLRFAVLEALTSAHTNEQWLSARKIAVILIVPCGEAEPQSDVSKWAIDLVPCLAEFLPSQFPVFRVTAACSSVAVALSLGSSLINGEQADIIVIAGSDPINIYDYASFNATYAITKETVRPFDIRRSGTLVGEGAGVFILESRASALDRQHIPYAWLEGMGFSMGGKDPQMVNLDSECVADAISTALEDAKSSTVDYIHAHAAGTKQGDVAECIGISKALSEAATIPVSSHKGATGHLLRCSGFLGIATGVTALITQKAPPTLGLNEPDPACSLSHIMDHSISYQISAVLVNSFGFCNNYASIVLRRVQGI
jgi:3-oxoacyl-[acyl-carrier-protein] synthase II